MPSLDIVSEVDLQEVDNAVNQTKKELGSRFDFKGSKFTVEWENSEIRLSAEDEYKIGAVKDTLQSKLHKRGIDISSLKFSDVTPAGHQTLKQNAEIKQGIDKETAKKINKHIKDTKLKVQPQVHDDKVRVTSKSIDTLRELMDNLKQQNFGLPLQFSNFR